jgi:hypothetical protein
MFVIFLQKLWHVIITSGIENLTKEAGFHDVHKTEIGKQLKALSESFKKGFEEALRHFKSSSSKVKREVKEVLSCSSITLLEKLSIQQALNYFGYILRISTIICKL